MTTPPETSPSLREWLDSKPHIMPLLWLIVLMLGQMIAVNFYLGLWRYGELGIHQAFLVYVIPTTVILWCILGAKGWLQRIDPADTALCLLALFVLLITFPALKAAIPWIVPYRYDGLLLSLEKTLHFGAYPYDLLRFLHTEIAITVLSFCYYVFFFLCCLALVAISFLPAGTYHREAFLIAFIATWHLNGAILAPLFSSVGPIYLEEFYNGQLANPFQADIASLCAMSSTTCDIRDWLLEMYRYGPVFDLNGPSAMPSLHIACTFLFALYAQRAFPRLAPIGWLFFVAIFVASIVLQWHYALDAYVAMISTGLIWWASLWWGKRHQRSLNDKTA